MKKTAIALISGGLDSLLAAKIVSEQGIQVKGVCFIMSFASKDVELFKEHVLIASKEAGIPTEIVDVSEEFLSVIKKPKHGYGAHINPCIDCKIFMLKKAKEMMEKEDASFILTGEVLGERPLSQKREALNLIEKESALKGYLLRPLSAKALKETIPEKEGLIDRGKLKGIRGRARNPQYALAKKYGIKTFFSPSGGCLLTYKQFADKIKDLIAHDSLDMKNIALAKYGRHFRLDNKTKAVLGRDKKDNGMILSLKTGKDLILRLHEKPSPYALLRGKTGRENILKTANLVVNHSKYKDKKIVKVEVLRGKEAKLIDAKALAQQDVEKIRI